MQIQKINNFLNLASQHERISLCLTHWLKLPYLNPKKMKQTSSMDKNRDQTSLLSTYFLYF